MSSISVTVEDSNNINLQVVPQSAIELTIDRGVPGPAGPNTIGGYGFNITSLQPQDVLMFGGAAWINQPQTEIADGGNY